MNEKEQPQEKTMSMTELQSLLASQGNGLFSNQFGQLLDQSIFFKDGKLSVDNSRVDAVLEKAKQTIATYEETARQNESLGRYYSAVLQQIETSINLLKKNSK